MYSLMYSLVYFTDAFTDVFPDVVTAAFTGAFADVFTGVFTDVFTEIFNDVFIVVFADVVLHVVVPQGAFWPNISQPANPRRSLFENCFKLCFGAEFRILGKKLLLLVSRISSKVLYASSYGRNKFCIEFWSQC